MRHMTGTPTTYRLVRATQQQLLAEAADIDRLIAQADAAIAALAEDPTASATLSTAGGSQSYTRANLSDLIVLRDDLKTRRARLIAAAAPSAVDPTAVITRRYTTVI